MYVVIIGQGAYGALPWSWGEARLAPRSPLSQELSNQIMNTYIHTTYYRNRCEGASDARSIPTVVHALEKF